ncbi:MAG: hypothetical protein CMJ19_13345 [Phycisphaeraceae bacterium]|nr:hypothetical protein [Phycisphaeraceae bacterium]
MSGRSRVGEIAQVTQILEHMRDGALTFGVLDGLDRGIRDVRSCRLQNLRVGQSFHVALSLRCF